MCLNVERESEIKELEAAILSAQTQPRLALGRTVRPEIGADKVAVLEQLSRTKAELEEEGMKDQARIAAEQQLQPTKATLEHELHMRDQQFNEATARLQHALLVKGQAIATYQQQTYQLQHQNEMNKQAIASAQQQFNHHVKA